MEVFARINDRLFQSFSRTFIKLTYTICIYTIQTDLPTNMEPKNRYIYPCLRPILSSPNESQRQPLVTLKTFHEHRKILGEEKRHTTNNETLELLFDLDSCFDYFSAFSVNRIEVKLNKRLYFLQRCSSLPTALFYCSIVLLWLVIVQL